MTAIFLAGAAGLRIGHAWLAPGRQRDQQSLIIASRESVVLLCGVFVMLLVAAAGSVLVVGDVVACERQYGVAALCWVGMLSYLLLQGRHAR